MALFKILRGDSSRISTDTTPFNDGYAYFTPDNAGFYIDALVNGESKRIRVRDDEKIAIFQGIENAGMILGIGSDGRVTPVSAFTVGASLTWGNLKGQ